MARRARSRISPSLPARMASRMRSRRSSRSMRSPPSNRCSPRPLWTASLSTARKKKRSNSSSNTRRSSCDFASVAASASRKSSWSVQLSSWSAWKESSSSEVPTAMPSLLSSSANSSRRAAKPGGPASGRPPYSAGLPGLLAPDEAILELHPHALGHHVEVGAVLHDDAHRALENGLVDLVGAEQEQCARPVDRLRDRRRLLQVEVAHHVHHLHELAGHLLIQLGRVQADDLELALHVRVVEPEVKAAALERLGQLARVVGGEQHEWAALGLDNAQLRDR